MAVRFRISGNLRFLSHAEVLRLFRRAAARAAVKLCYSQGFNPRPRLSLPLPKSVGLESDDDLLCLKVQMSPEFRGIEQFRTRLCDQLPDGCELLSLEPAPPKSSFQPAEATYVVPLNPESLDLTLTSRIKRLLASQTLNIRRTTDAKGSVRTVDVRPFLKSIEIDRQNILVKCKITPDGTIRVDEILKLLELPIQNLAAPLRRASVRYQSN